MRKRFISLLYISCVILLIHITACNKDILNADLPAWTPTIAFPLLSANLSLDQIIEEGDNIQFDDDHLINFVFTEDSIISVVVSDLIDIPLQDPISENYKLGIIEIPDFNIYDSVSLETITSSMEEDIQNIIQLADGEIAYFPPFVNTSPTIIDLPILEGVIRAHFSNGLLTLVVTNNFPVPMEDMQMVLKNVGDNSTVFDVIIDYLEPGVSETVEINLTEKDITDQMNLVLEEYSSPGSGNNPFDSDSWVPINLSDALIFDINGIDLEVSSGIAEVAEQTFSSESSILPLEFDEYRLSQIDFKDTYIEYTINSNIQADINISLHMPEAHNISSGEVFNALINVPYSTSGDPVIGQIDLSNTSFDLSSAENNISINYELEIIPIGDLIEFDSSNMVQFELLLNDIDFSLIKGYLGTNTFEFDEGAIDLDLNFLDEFEGDFSIEGTAINLNYVNSIGLPIAAKLEMVGYDEDGNTQSLNYQSSPGNDTMYFNFPQTIGEEISDHIFISDETSDVGELIDLFPNRIEYSGLVTTNTFGDGQENFVTDESKVTLGFEINTPFNIKASNMSFQDTINMSLGDSINVDVNYIDLKMNVINGFPFDIALQLILIDSVSMYQIDTIAFSEPISSGVIDSDGKVESPTTSELSLRIDQMTFENLKAANKTIIKARISTGNGGQQAVKFYSNYELEIYVAVLAELKIDEI